MSSGSVPVILSNTLLLPIIGEFNWTDCVVIGNEKDIKGLYEELKEIDDEKLEMMSNNCIKYYNKYFSNENIQNLIMNYYQNKV
jgi:glycosyltransferase involved in cell wall biosynthesis